MGQLAATFRMKEAEAKARERAGYDKSKLEADYHKWLTRLLPRHFRGLDQFAPHHEQFWSWFWPIKKGERLSDGSSCLYMANRGGAKSTQCEGAVVYSGAVGARKYALCVTRTQSQADKHVRTINSMLLSSNIGQVYPDMARPQLQRVGRKDVQSAWNREQLTTANGWTVQGFGLLSSERGIRIEEFRPDLIWITDIDDEHDSTGMVDTLIAALSGAILGTQSSDCVIIFDQNLIHRDSVINRILTRKSDVLSVRKEIGPIPAVNKPEYERKNERWSFLSGSPSWPQGMPVEVCTSVLNTVGKQMWEREYQNNINLAYADAVYPMWDEVFHLITWSEFAQGFIRAGAKREWFYDRNDKPMLPARGKIVQAQDWGNRAEHPCANRWCWTPAEEMRLNKFVFFYREMCWPRFPVIEGDDRAHPSALQVGEAIQEVEREWNEASRVTWRLASHERPEIVQAYRIDMPKAGLKPLSFAQIDTRQARDGILHMQNFLFVEPDKPHPFRVYPFGHPQAGQPLLGCPRAFFVIADGQGELYWDEGSGTLKVMPAINESGMARTRYEYPNYRKPDTMQGAEKKDAPKKDDDIVDTDRAIAGLLFPTIEQMTEEMKIQAAIPEHLKPEYISHIPDPAARSIAEQGAYQAYYTAKHTLQRQGQRSRGPYADAQRKHAPKKIY